MVMRNVIGTPRCIAGVTPSDHALGWRLGPASALVSPAAVPTLAEFG